MNYDRFKFRVWDEVTKRYLNREYVHVVDGGFKPYFSEEVDGLIIEQCTGIKDTTGNLIYEGDIISGRNPDVKHVVKHEEDLALFLAHLLPLNEFGTLTSNISQAWMNEFGKVVVGNIHENPELLKEEAK